MAYRITLLVLCLLSTFFMPFWVSLLLALVGIAYFPVFWEVVLVFFIADLLYGAEREIFFNILYASTLASGVLLIAGEALKKKLKFYPN